MGFGLSAGSARLPIPHGGGGQIALAYGVVLGRTARCSNFMFTELACADSATLFFSNEQAVYIVLKAFRAT